MNRDSFIRMCHKIYDPIHGKEKVKKIFYPINEMELITLIKIYNNEFYQRAYMIQKYIESINTLQNTIKIYESRKSDTSIFYINAIQHFISNDY